MTTKRGGSRVCVERECPVDRVFDYEHQQAIVTHGNDRFAGDLRYLNQTMYEYDRWVDLLHARDDALTAPIMDLIDHD